MTAAPFIFPADPQNFQTDVLERSKEVPIVVLFWAQQMPQSVEARQHLETQVNALQGKLALALVDVAVDQSLAQHLRVQGLPSIRVIKDGQLAEQLDGPQTQEALSALCDRLTMSGSELLKEQLTKLLDAGNFDAALALLQQAIGEEPNNPTFRIELADVLILQGNLSEARTALANIEADAPGSARPRERLAFADEAAALEPLATLQVKVAADVKDLEALYQCCVVLAAANRMEEALEAALDILCANRKFRDDLGRTTLLRLFELLPKGSPLATAYRRRMFNFMH